MTRWEPCHPERSFSIILRPCIKTAAPFENCGKGMMKPIKDRHPDINIVAIDYDAGATRVNQVNRLKLMLANARQNERDAAGARSA